MNEYNNESNRGPMTPYKASGNLNTAIGNPTININDTMNVNIQSMSTNNSPILEPQIQNTTTVQEINVSNPHVANVQVENTQQTIPEETKQNAIPVNIIQNINKGIEDNQNNSKTKKTYVSMDNKAKKKKLSLSLGPEFKIALLIVVILLVFVLFLPMISEVFNGY